MMSERKFGPSQEGIIWADRPSLYLILYKFIFVIALIIGISMAPDISQYVPNFKYDRWVNIGKIAIYFFAIAHLLTAILRILSTQYTLTDDRLLIRTGIMVRVTEQIELFRVRDLTMEQALSESVFGLGTLWIVSSDRSSPLAALQGIRDVEAVADAVRHAVSVAQDRVGYRQYEVS
jgi:uncharacterized membrane protein YdbT with pleckstrin-like domain